MIQIVSATFTNGVLRPDTPLQLLSNERVRLVVVPLEATECQSRLENWAAIEELWRTSRVDSGGDILTREQLHERR